MTRARIAGRICITPAGNGIQVTGSDDVAVEGNLIVATGACGHAVRLHSETSEMDGISVNGNEVTVADAGSWETGSSSAPACRCTTSPASATPSTG